MDYGVLGANTSETESWINFITAVEDIIFYQPQQLKGLGQKKKKKRHRILWSIKKWLNKYNFIKDKKWNKNEKIGWMPENP